ncbi:MULTISPECIES: cell division topological specificity factor MinE [unclassified Alcanivorax]|jgi:cell division topological specificity factor|uniref:cell division topological specificity factor MinE n=1 Tax=unclassified Alcanivorax TaxID=2638842 RepID=UPI000789F119|nr:MULTISPECIES: cell division topological specificity factor MinE [unclassified Alcanivorax]KZX73811.1 cell division topological specificity factor [Alcanivorax sp. HI0013]KZX79725.1 cell division topological specificity factor [Alcanivorax sp. HI0011]KZY23133.1 cell division topological specificity factor [Alcanivorax sp. HI0035]MED5387513.1 cell division topological specificity factor MinE [Pseudomonadota bacterium]KZX61921.1 cell division topological specificity factor [Alcanivorax sp. HI0|tara:strand:+ start:286 stop:552 length:267 start_codon:yes stop_codon:yes gene_type:complete
MSIFSYLLPKKQSSASVAKERLQIIVARERSTRGGPDYLPQLQEELLQVVRKYVPVDQDAVNIQLDRESGCEILELNITLPEEAAQQS